MTRYPQCNLRSKTFRTSPKSLCKMQKNALLRLQVPAGPILPLALNQPQGGMGHPRLSLSGVRVEFVRSTP